MCQNPVHPLFTDFFIFQMVVALPNSNDTNLAVMFQDFNVSANSDLEVLFTCFVMSWNDSSTDVIHRLNNPSFQILYDDVLVFNMEVGVM